MKTRIFLCNGLVLFFASVMLMGCSKSNMSDESEIQALTGTSGSGVIRNVQIISNTYSPATLHVLAYETVSWRNNDNMVHTVTANDDSFHSGDIQPGATYNLMFKDIGSHAYHCIYHEKRGVINVAGIK